MTNNVPQEILDYALRVADSALLTAILRRVSESNPEIAKTIFTDALSLISDEQKFEGEETIAQVARHVLNNKLAVLLKEIQPASQGGFQTQVR